MPHSNSSLWPRTGRLLALATMTLVASADAQPSALLEACNAVDDKDKRLACFKELATLKSPAAGAVVSNKRVKDAFSAVSGAVGSGVSLQNYSLLLLEPSKELEIFRQERPTPSRRVLELYDEALLSYRDAEKVWHASIFDSKDRGSAFGRILNPDETGLKGIFNKYNLPTRNISILTDTALEAIWSHARKRVQAANNVFDDPSADVEEKSAVPFYAGAARAMGLVLGEIPTAQLQEMKIKGGVRVESAVDAAGRAGLLAGDIVLSLGNHEVFSVVDFEQEIATRDKSKSLPVLVRREGSVKWILIKAGG